MRAHSSRSSTLLSLPFEDFTSTSLFLCPVFPQKRKPLIQKPFWEGFLFPSARMKSASAAHEKFREGQWHHHGHTANQRNSPTLALFIVNCFLSLSFRDNWVESSVWPDIMWFYSRDQATYYLKETLESDLWVFLSTSPSTTTLMGTQLLLLKERWMHGFALSNSELGQLFVMCFNMHVYVQSGRHWVL